MTKAEKLLNDYRELEKKKKASYREFGLKELALQQKLAFSGIDPCKNEPKVGIVITNEMDVRVNGEKPQIGLRVESGDADKIVVRGYEELVKFRDWLDGLLGNYVIETMKEKKNEDSGPL